jgi:hypothetical protein
MLDSASAGFVQSRQRRQFRVYVRRSPSRKFETLFISCERNIADGRRCQSHREKGRVQIVQAVHSLRSFRPLVRQNLSAPLSFESRRLSSLLVAISFCATACAVKSRYSTTIKGVAVFIDTWLVLSIRQKNVSKNISFCFSPYLPYLPASVSNTNCSKPSFLGGSRSRKRGQAIFSLKDQFVVC